ncbi:phosphate ABC transporter permease subunit PstC [Alterisphingorhabdus coralli]|uniref:Phosphate transport system permease protein n=1 Tax=Alterisphingorhabdus coralli TaxID=3071408 RepID=A0AA97I0B3_9SPHN|nr:phosphate ABC transporter permease subunit PstC [Parasphingorhabdus sp. SCSIO 66989]WOE74238.1 phosphate ABC transporter permease subunit PstC [Parasphingorhabdus sp. SCSIO 66989]
MAGFAFLFLIVGLGVLGWLFGRAKANRFVLAGKSSFNSLPNYHGWYVALWAMVPVIIFASIWISVSPALTTNMVLADPAAASLPEDPFARASVLSEARALSRDASSQSFNPEAATLAPIYASAENYYQMIGIAAALLLGFAGAAYAFLKVRPDFRARSQVERVVLMVLLIASLIAILVTIGIVASLVFETIRFFTMVSPLDFLFGLEWNPKPDPDGQDHTGFGALPLFWGTIFIGAIIAMIVAIPFGLMSAVYLTQYAPASLRSWMKPILEILAGVPTVVYGYFAALTVAPAILQFANSMGIENASIESALAAGLVMGVMIIPFVSSMADDSIAAVPNAMRDGSLAMGATPSETIKKVLIPAALPGVVGGVLLAVSRAIGETMIVVMAAGLAANMTANPFQSVTTVTVQIVQLLTGDTDFEGPMTLAAFALGLALFFVTLLLNLVALQIVKRYRESYE